MLTSVGHIDGQGTVSQHMWPILNDLLFVVLMIQLITKEKKIKNNQIKIW